MIELLTTEAEFFKILLLGIFFGWTARKLLYGTDSNTPWMTINNLRFNQLNHDHRIKTIKEKKFKT